MRVFRPNTDPSFSSMRIPNPDADVIYKKYFKFMFVDFILELIEKNLTINLNTVIRIPNDEIGQLRQ